ncbi:MAG TPA: MarR family transcriptional regulator [Solirubrobacteraceae bacterium]|nr:MarR family transcriptional regulator [Solirubrobacteraceae bacterium]
MPERMSAEELAAWRGFLQAHARLVRELDEELRAVHGLPLSSYDVLTTLESSPDRRLRMRELADAVLLSRSGLTRLVDRLVREGHVVREECADDARGAFAVLTDTGLAALREARPTHHDGVRRRFLSRLEPGEAPRLGATWDRIKGSEST